MKSYFIPLVAGILLLFVPKVRAGWFEDSHECQGLRDEVTSTCAWGDYDNDGDQELFVGTSNNMGCHLWKKTAIGFEDKAIDLGIDFHGIVAASCWGDFNNDGWLDLFIANGSEYDGCFLYQNLGPDRDYSFARVSDLPFNDALAEAKGAVWGDFNNDGILDLFVAYGDYENAGPRDYLYLGDGSNFNDEVWRFDESGVPGDVTATDMDGDGDLDVFVVINSGRCHLFRNQYDPEYPDVINFEDQAFPSGVDLRDATSASFADYNYDGKPDLFITGNDPNVGSYLFRNDGNDASHINFTNVTEEQFYYCGNHQPMAGNGAAWGDFDLDGDLDLYIIGNGIDTLYQNGHRENLDYFLPKDRPTTGLGDDALSLCTEWADFNNDGKPDIFMGNLISQDGDEYFDKLYKNDYSGAPQNRYISIKLIGANCGIVPPETLETNKSGIGAKVRLSYRLDGVRTCQWGEVSGGGTGSHSQGSLPLEFGVGKVSSIDSVLVYWPSGDTSIFEDVSAGQRITIVEHGVFAGPGALMTWDWHIHGNYYFSGDIRFGWKDVDLAGLTILGGTKVLAHKTYRVNKAPKIYFQLFRKYLTTYGTPNNPVCISSQYSSPSYGDWEGLVIDYPDSVYLNGTIISFANTGLSAYGVDFYPLDIQIDKCSFISHYYGGIVLYRPAIYKRMKITDSLFDHCLMFGIHIKKDDLGGEASYFANDTIRNSTIGIYYFGNVHPPDPPDPNVPVIENCVMNSSTPNSGYGIYMSSLEVSNHDFWIRPRIENDSISGFNTGIWLQMVHSEGKLISNRIKSNGAYGLFLQSSSPNLYESEYGVPNIFRDNKIGINCDGRSYPIVTGTVFRDHISRSSIIQTRIGTTPMPNFTGPNSFTQTSIWSGFRYIQNDNDGISLMATGNYWGVSPPPPWAFNGPVIWDPCLPSDQYGGYEKRECQGPSIPERAALLQNYPNPFNPTTEISYYLAEPGYGSLKIYSITGQLVKTLVSGNLAEGEHDVIWDGRNNRGTDVASGIYFYVLSTGKGRISKTMTLLR